MSISHFIKHLSCTLCSRRLLHSSKPLSALSSSILRPRSHCRASSILATTSTCSAPEASVSDPYLSVRVRCRKDIADTLSEALLNFGASSTSVDQEDVNGSSDDEVCIDSIFAECDNVGQCILRAADSIGLEETPYFEVKEGDQSEWILQSQESFHPVEVMEGLWIVPEWSAPPDPQAINIILNPGLSFGTGEHPTTKLCISLLHGLIKGGELFLDYGTGSGILAIAALKFGAALSVGVDIDPVAIKSARHNASLNDIEDEKLPLHLVPSENTISDLEQSGKYDVVIANILMNPLLNLADHIVAHAKPGAVVGVSGILSEQLPCIKDRYSQFLDDISVSEFDGWGCLSGTKKTSLC